MNGPREALITPVLTTNHPKAQCVDLKATFGKRFKYCWDEAYAAELPELRKGEGPWLVQIPGRYGYVFPWGGRAPRTSISTLPESACRYSAGQSPSRIAHARIRIRTRSVRRGVALRHRASRMRVRDSGAPGRDVCTARCETAIAALGARHSRQ